MTAAAQAAWISHITWFKQHFQARIEPALAGTPLPVDLIVAIACQETGYLWGGLRKGGSRTPDEVMALCAGDSIGGASEGGGRRAFPRDRRELESVPGGAEMFAMARAMLEKGAQLDRGYAGAARNPDKFFRAFGVFQRDLQFFKEDPQYFLRRRWESFDGSLAHCVALLKQGLAALGWSRLTQLDETQQMALAVRYNTGRWDPSRGEFQGHRDGDGVHYGTHILRYLRLARLVSGPGAATALPAPLPGQAITLPPSLPMAAGPALAVAGPEGMAPLLAEADADGSRVVANLPEGHPVQAVGGRAQGGVREVETVLRGALLRGFVPAKWLRKLQQATPAEPEPMPLGRAAPGRAGGRVGGRAGGRAGTAPPVAKAAPAARAGRGMRAGSGGAVPLGAPATSADALAQAATGLPEAHLPHRPGQLVRRTAPAGAFSLNETGAPGRHGSTAEELCSELAQIVDWLAVDDARHVRYQPTATATFCNIYAHDFCRLAGAYLPRVWWTGPALMALSRGQPVAPLAGSTVVEVRINTISRWLEQFGLAYGWRATGSATKAQLHANQGGLALVVARHRVPERSGHVTVIIPETVDHRARRGADGEVAEPLQSQAGRRNVRRGSGSPGRAPWYASADFENVTYWIHA